MSYTIGEVAKALNAGLGAAATAATVALQNGHVEFWEWFTIVGSFAVAFLAVFLVDNTPRNMVYKAIAAAVVAVGAFLGTALLDGSLSSDEWIGLAGAVVTAFMTWYAPNAPSSVNGV